MTTTTVLAIDASPCTCSLGCRSREEMRRAHGTPEAFAQAARDAVGEISVAEAFEGIADYEREYASAPETVETAR